MHLRISIGILVAAVLAGCGGAPLQGQVGDSQSLPPFLKPWATFPVQASPRPIVFVDGPVGVSAGFGFPDGPSKEAFMNGAVDPPARLPTGPATAHGYPVISAADAVALLQRPANSKAANAAATTPGRRLTIAGVRFGDGEFLTDRGQRTMPVWQFSLAGIDGDVSVLAVAPTAQWQPPGSSTPTGRIDVGASTAIDHRTLTLRFTGGQSGSGPCAETYTLVLTESSTAVLATVITHRNDSTGTVNCTLMGYPRTASAVLQAPLGNRVVIEGFSGGVIAVTGSP